MKRLVLFAAILLFMFLSGMGILCSTSFVYDRNQSSGNMQNQYFNQGTQGHALEGLKDTYRATIGKDPDAIKVPDVPPPMNPCRQAIS